MTTPLEFTPIADAESGWDAFVDSNFSLIRKVLGGQEQDGDLPPSEPRQIKLYPDRASLPVISIGGGAYEAALSFFETGSPMRLVYGNASTGSPDRKDANYYTVPVEQLDVVDELGLPVGVSGWPNVEAIPNLTATASVTALRDNMNADLTLIFRDNKALGTQQNLLIEYAVESGVFPEP